MNSLGDPMEFLIAHNSLLANSTVNGYELIIIVWNLLLLLVPVFLYFVLFRLWRKSGFASWSGRISGLFLGFLWLIFLPNAAYLITEVRHLLDFCPRGSEFDICETNAWMIAFFFFYSILGWPVFVYLVKRMSDLVREIWGGFVSFLFQAAIPPFCAIGILLGLVNRWNSWEIFIYPSSIFNSSYAYISTNDGIRNLVFFVVLLYLLYFIGIKFFVFARD